jgi:hypothetical protein
MMINASSSHELAVDLQKAVKGAHEKLCVIRELAGFLLKKTRLQDASQATRDIVARIAKRESEAMTSEEREDTLGGPTVDPKVTEAWLEGRA